VGQIISLTDPSLLIAFIGAEPLGSPHNRRKKTVILYADTLQISIRA
jgi:hypothetical protein